MILYLCYTPIHSSCSNEQHSEQSHKSNRRRRKNQLSHGWPIDGNRMEVVISQMRYIYLLALQEFGALVKTRACCEFQIDKQTKCVRGHRQLLRLRLLLYNSESVTPGAMPYQSWYHKLLYVEMNASRKRARFSAFISSLIKNSWNEWLKREAIFHSLDLGAYIHLLLQAFCAIKYKILPRHR